MFNNSISGFLSSSFLGFWFLVSCFWLLVFGFWLLVFDFWFIKILGSEYFLFLAEFHQGLSISFSLNPSIIIKYR